MSCIQPNIGAIDNFYKDDVHILDWENADLSRDELFAKLEAAKEARWPEEDPEAYQDIQTEIMSWYPL